LLHGGKDILVHASQSVKFAKQIEANGGSAELMIFPDLNHTFISPNNPIAFKKAIITIAHFYQKELGLNFDEFSLLEKDMDAMLGKYFPVTVIEEKQILGKWKGKSETLSLLEGGKAEIINKRGKVRPASYQNNGKSFELSSNGPSQTFYLRRDGRVIYEILQDERSAGKKQIYTKQK
jgi:hypothetical protein